MLRQSTQYYFHHTPETEMRKSMEYDPLKDTAGTSVPAGKIHNPQERKGFWDLSRPI